MEHRNGDLNAARRALTGSEEVNRSLPPTLARLFTPRQQEYLLVSRTATYGYLAALPLVILYEILIVLTNEGALNEIRVGADVWIKRALASLGKSGLTVLGGAAIAIGAIVFIYDRRRNIPIRARYFVWMLIESLVWAVILGYAVGSLVSALFAMMPAASFTLLQIAQEADTSMMLALSLGAGIYEELVFRVVLVGGLAWVLTAVTGADRRKVYWIAAILGALIFSWVHYIGSLGDPFTLSSFTFRFLLGLALNGLFVLRGFGVAAWTHALYDVIVVLFFQ